MESENGNGKLRLDTANFGWLWQSSTSIPFHFAMKHWTCKGTRKKQTKNLEFERYEKAVNVACFEILPPSLAISDMLMVFLKYLYWFAGYKLQFFIIQSSISNFPQSYFSRTAPDCYATNSNPKTILKLIFSLSSFLKNFLNIAYLKFPFKISLVQKQTFKRSTFVVFS